MSEQAIRVLVVIPALEPGPRFLELLQNLQTSFDKQENSNITANILVIDDGSPAEYLPLFKQAQEQYNCTVLRHAVNLGKGRALKTAFNHYLNECTGYTGLVTADSDGQHSVHDIIKCINELSASDSLILGCRDFGRKNIPFRSLIGNRLTRSIFGFLCGIKVSDTQTGLRCIPDGLVKEMVTIPGERFEFEMNMLIECGNKKIKIKEVKIETIYLDNNRSSHFNPVLDSIRVYKTFVKYIISALSSFLLDIALFAVIVFVTKEVLPAYILVSTVAARIISSFYNYMINKNIVFAGNRGRNTLLKYYGLAVSIMLASGALTTFLFGISFLNEVGSKVLVDTVLFLCSYYVQKKWIF